MDFDRFVKLVGANVRRARLAAGLTQEQATAEVITYRLLGELERGKDPPSSNPTLRTLFLLAERLGVSVADLVDVPGLRRSKTPLAERPLHPPKPGPKAKPKRRTTK